MSKPANCRVFLRGQASVVLLDSTDDGLEPRASSNLSIQVLEGRRAILEAGHALLFGARNEFSV